VYDNLDEGSDTVRIGAVQMHLRGYLERFLFDGAKQRQSVGSLSGGERARLVLAKMLRGDANLVVLDEPTNDLDLTTLATLEELLTSFEGCVVVVTHDRYFLNRVATSILAFEAEHRVVRYAGNYDDYLAQRAAAVERRPDTSTDNPAEPLVPAEQPRGDRRARRPGLTLGERHELAALPDRIDQAERALATLDVALNDPALYVTRGGEVAGLSAQRESAQRALDQLMLRWETLEQKRG
jgi:ATP-binding cassette subfamily F protein uup